MGEGEGEGDGEGGATEEVEDMAGATFTGHSDAVYCVAVNPKNPSQVKHGCSAYSPKVIAASYERFLFSRRNRMEV